MYERRYCNRKVKQQTYAPQLSKDNVKMAPVAVIVVLAVHAG